jgi:predicted P-loop ATPase
MNDADGDNVRPFVAPKPDWMGLLERSANGGDPWPTVANAMLVLANDAKFKGMLGHDTFSGERVLRSAPPPFQQDNLAAPGPYPRGWTNSDISLVLGYCQRVWGRKWTRSVVADAMEAVAEQNPFHPVLNWIDGLVWDEVKRIDTWLVTAFDPVNEFNRDSDDWKAREKYYSAIGWKMLVASVRRLRRPAVKFDSILILEGEQRLGKSTAIETLYGRRFFTDTVFADLRNKEAAQGLHGKWVVEFSEIEQIIRSDVETLKAFLSRNTDHFRPPYERHFRDVERQGVFFGTTNQQDYLKDTTGNTRFWMAACQKADVEWIAANRDQLWAEAAAREAEGDKWRLWLDTSELQADAERLTSARMREDIWQVAVARWLDKTEEERAAAKKQVAQKIATETEAFLAVEPIFIARILEHAIGMSKDKMSKQAEMRVADVLKALGWVGTRNSYLPKIKDKPARGKTTVWRKPDEALGADI